MDRMRPRIADCASDILCSQKASTPCAQLYGSRTANVISQCCAEKSISISGPDELLDGTPYPVALARYMVEHEWVRRLDDFVERRLMLLYHRPLTRRCLEQLADVLVQAKRIDAAERARAVDETIARLREQLQQAASLVQSKQPIDERPLADDHHRPAGGGVVLLGVVDAQAVVERRGHVVGRDRLRRRGPCPCRRWRR